MERVDGTQARLKHLLVNISDDLARRVERVDGTQARLKQTWTALGIAHALVERVDGTQARLKQPENAPV